MSLRSDRQHARSAEIRAVTARHELVQNSRPLRGFWRRHRTALVIGGGLAAGVLASLLPVRAFARAGSTAGALVGLALRSPFAPLMLGWIAKAREEQPPLTQDGSDAAPAAGSARTH